MCGSLAPFVPINDYERLEQAKQSVEQAEYRFNQISIYDSDKYAESIIEQLQSAKLYLNSLLKELKAKKIETNVLHIQIYKC